MNNNNVVEGNKLIAEFLGWEKASQEVYFVPNLYPETKYSTGHTTFHTSEMQFEKRWDFLMPVVDKISGLEKELGASIEFKIMSGFAQIFYAKGFRPNGNFINSNAEKTIDAAWNVAVRFIQWYTNQIPTTANNLNKMI